jgi:hypothetical protein
MVVVNWTRVFWKVAAFQDPLFTLHSMLAGTAGAGLGSPSFLQDHNIAVRRSRRREEKVFLRNIHVGE